MNKDYISPVVGLTFITSIIFAAEPTQMSCSMLINKIETARKVLQTVSKKTHDEDKRFAMSFHIRSLHNMDLIYEKNECPTPPSTQADPQSNIA